MSIPPSDSTVLNPPDSAKLISSSSSSVVGSSTPGPSNAFSFKHATFQQVLDDLSCRFILNLPDEELSSIERVCFQVEQAHWYYEDFVRDANPKFPSLPLKKFSEHLFKACPMLHHWSADHEQAFNQFMAYKTRVPVCGAIMLNPTLDKCVLVKGFKASSGWGFPKGKINQNEKESDCAVREVLEETGYNLASQINDQDYVNIIVREQSITLFMVPDIPEDYEFKTRTRKEISKIEWFKMSDLPSWKKKKETPGKFYLIAPFISYLKDFVSRKKRERKLEMQMHSQTQVLQGEESITVSVDMTIPLPRTRKHPHTSSISGSGFGSGGESPTTKESTSSSSGGDGGPKTPSPDQPLDERVEVVGAVASMDDQLRNLLMKMGGGVQLAVSDLKPAVSVPPIPEPIAPLQDSLVSLQTTSTSSTSSTTTETQVTVAPHVPRAATSAPASSASVQSASSIDLKRTKHLALLNSVMEELTPTSNPHRAPFPVANSSSTYPNSLAGAPVRAASAFLPAFYSQSVIMPNQYPQFNASGRPPNPNVGFVHHIPQPHPQSPPRQFPRQHSVSMMQGAGITPPLPLPIPHPIPQGEMLYTSGPERHIGVPRELQPHQNQLLNLLSPRLRARTASQPVRNLPFNDTPNLPPIPPLSLHPMAVNQSYSPAGPPFNGRVNPAGFAPQQSGNLGLLSILNSGMAPATAIAAPP